MYRNSVSARLEACSAWGLWGAPRILMFTSIDELERDMFVKHNPETNASIWNLHG